MDTVILCAWLFAPTAFSNGAPVLANNIPGFIKFSQPLDAGFHFRGKRVFGDNKTVRGLLSGIAMGIICGFIQYILANNFTSFSTITNLLDYANPSILLYTASIGAGVIAGDAIESFFKRQLDIAPGKNWIPFDQLDFILGAIAVSLLFYSLSLTQYVVLFLLALILHPTLNIISWLLGLQKRPF